MCKLYKRAITKKRILVIEDNPTILKDLQVLLETENFEVITACDGEEGLKKYFSSKPEFVLSDITMPKKDGFEVIKYLRDNKLLQNTPFIFLTAREEYKDFRRGMNLGADDYIRKPYNPGDLLQSIKTRMEKFISIRETYRIVINGVDDLSSIPKIRINAGTHFIYVESAKIICIKADRQYSKVVLDNQKEYMVKRSLNKWEEMLDGAFFLRIHRSTIVNKKYIASIEKIGRTQKTIFLINVEKGFAVSRKYCKNLKWIY